MIERLKGFLSSLKINGFGRPNVRKKLIVIESDDWGAIRTPSKEALAECAKKGFELEKSVYKIDSLASENDLSALFELLLSHKNVQGKNPVFTANAVMANPDFTKIEESDFTEYFYEPFTETFKNYPKHKNNLSLWKNAENAGIFFPEFHGREHLNINRWLKRLQHNDEFLKYSFKLRSTYSGFDDYAFMEAYDWDEKSDINQHKEILIEGARIFESVFNRKPSSFIAPCYNWDPELEQTISSIGVKWIQGIGSQHAPTGAFGEYKNIRHKFGKSNGYGSCYNIRNVFFEPVYNPNKDWSDLALARIHAAFLMHKPAVISTHRLNYVGFIDPKNRDNGLRHLDALLKRIIRTWPDVDFVTTAELSNYIKD